MATKTGRRVTVDAINIEHQGPLTIETAAAGRALIIINFLLPAKKRPRSRRKHGAQGRPR